MDKELNTMNIERKKYFFRLAILLILQLGIVFFPMAQDTMIQKVQKESGQTSPIIIWLFVAIIPVLFLIFAIRKGDKTKKERGKSSKTPDSIS